MYADAKELVSALEETAQKNDTDKCAQKLSKSLGEESPFDAAAMTNEYRKLAKNVKGALREILDSTGVKV